MPYCLAIVLVAWAFTKDSAGALLRPPNDSGFSCEGPSPTLQRAQAADPQRRRSYHGVACPRTPPLPAADAGLACCNSELGAVSSRLLQVLAQDAIHGLGSLEDSSHIRVEHYDVRAFRVALRIPANFAL
jgi:hypothetical protein